MVRHAKLPYVQRYQQRDGTWRFRGFCDVGSGALRKRVFSSVQDTEAAAHATALRMRRAYATHGEALTLNRAVDVLLEEVRTKRTEGSVVWYRQHLDAVRLKIPGDTPLYDITAATVEAFVRARQRDFVVSPAFDEGGRLLRPGRHVKPATINADLRALNRVFVVAKKLDPTMENPVPEVERPRADTAAMEWFEEAELRDLLAKVTDDAARDLFALFALTGMRRSEVARLTTDSIRLPTAQLIVAGKNRTRTLPIRPQLDPIVRRMLTAACDPATANPGNHLVPGRLPKDPARRRGKDTTGASRDRIHRTFTFWRRRLGEPRLRPHALRHTFGTALVRRGVSLDVVMRLMGHSKITTTQIYLHVAGHHSGEALDLLDVVPALLDAQPQPAQG